MENLLLFFTSPLTTNWYDLLNYPHVGKGSAQYVGPPILFLLLNFAIFGWLFKKFIWKMIKGAVESRSQEFSDLVESANRMEKDAFSKFSNAKIRKKKLELEKEELINTINRESELAKEKIFNEVKLYENARKNETKQQILLKTQMVEKAIKGEIINDIINQCKTMIPIMMNPTEKAKLIQAALNLSENPEREL